MRGAHRRGAYAWLALAGFTLVSAALLTRPDVEGGEQDESEISRDTGRPCAGQRAPPDGPSVQESPSALGTDGLLEGARSVSPDVVVGAVVVDRAKGAKLLEANRDRPFPSASLVKLLIAIDALDQADAVDEELRSELTTMLAKSDNAIASELWSLGGGADIVERTEAMLDLRGTAPPSIPGQWGATSTTPDDIVAVYQFILNELEPAHCRLIVSALDSAPRIASDGFDQHFGIPEAFDGQWAIKQGWSTTQDVVGAHSTGIVGSDRRYIVVVLTEHPPSVSMETGARAVTTGLRRLARDL